MELGFLPKSSVYEAPVSNQTFMHLGEFANFRVRPYASLELETSTRCSLSCPSCPRVTFGRSWIERDMSLEVFEEVSRYFGLFETIHFRGWGDPLLNPHFPEMVRAASKSGARLILSTNGVILPNLDLLQHFSAITFRLDYGRAATYERRNPMAKFNRAIFNISQVLHYRNKVKSSPKISIMFAKNKYSFNELPDYLETAARLHPDRVVFYHPRFHVRIIDSRAKLPAEVDAGLLKKMDERLESMASSAGLDVINQPAPEADGTSSRCVFDPENSFYVSWNGHLAICRHSALPVVGGAFTRYMSGRGKNLQAALFGSLLEHGFQEIIQDRKFREIREACMAGVRRPITEGHGCAPQMETSAGRENVIPISSRRKPLNSGFCSLTDHRS